MFNLDKKIDSILYVEDEKSSQEELAKFLELFCRKLYIASDGQEGLEEFKKHKPKIIVSDIQMPKLNGIEMIKEIKQIEPSVKVVFTTAFSDASYFQEAIELQVDGYILKPIDMDSIERKILDLIEQLRLKEELKQKDQILYTQSKMISLGEMIGNIAHQWRQPLNHISLLTTKLLLQKERKGSISDEVLEKCIDDVNEQTAKLSKTIDNLRNLADSKNTENDTYKISELIDKCIRVFDISSDDYDVSISKEIESSIKDISFSSYLIQILINIFNNSLDAFRKVSEELKKLHIQIYVEKDDDYILLTFIDNAGGIDEDIIGKIFEPYFTTKHQSQGKGLGLYISYQIVTNKLNGTIFVENKEFKLEDKVFNGTQFTLRLPII